MAATDALHEGEADLAALAALPGEIRARVKAGLAELAGLRDAIDAELTRLADGARGTLASLQGSSATPAPADAAPAA